MKIIFLDIDGVLNHATCKVKAPSGFCFVDDKCMIKLKKIIEKTGAKLVLSSTWRQGYYDLLEGKRTSGARDYEALLAKLQQFGMYIYGHTPVLKRGNRGSEILTWLQNSNVTIDSFVILDDSKNIYPLQQYHVQTSFREGLKWKHVGEAVRLLCTSARGGITTENM